MINVIRLTILWDIDKKTLGSTTVKTLGSSRPAAYVGAVLDLRADQQDEHMCTQGKRQAIHLCAGERWAGARDIDNDGVLGGGGGRDSMRMVAIVEKFEDLVTGSDNLQVLQFVDIELGGSRS